MSNTNTSIPKSPEGIDHQAWLESLKAGDKVWWTDPDDGLSSGEVTILNIRKEGVRVFDDTIFEVTNEAGSQMEVWADEINTVDPYARAPLNMRLVLDINYVPFGVDAETLKGLLHKMCMNAIGNGMLTGHTEAEVDGYSLEILEVPEPLSEEELSSFMLDRIENAELSLEDIPVRLARYGLMEPAAFVTEMRERMQAVEAG